MKKIKNKSRSSIKYIPIYEIHSLISDVIKRLTNNEISPSDAETILKSILTYHNNG